MSKKSKATQVSPCGITQIPTLPRDSGGFITFSFSTLKKARNIEWIYHANSPDAIDHSLTAKELSAQRPLALVQYNDFKNGGCVLVHDHLYDKVRANVRVLFIDYIPPMPSVIEKPSEDITIEDLVSRWKGQAEEILTVQGHNVYMYPVLDIKDFAKWNKWARRIQRLPWHNKKKVKMSVVLPVI